VKDATYNLVTMPSITFLSVRRARLAALALACVAPLAAVHAQSAPPPAAEQDAKQQERAEGRRNQKIERIHVEDAGASVDEVRYGGQTQSITVQPKANVPSYEVMRPGYGGRGPERPGATDGDSGGNGNGPRVWNLMKF
jgi:hypothetical protein